MYSVMVIMLLTLFTISNARPSSAKTNMVSSSTATTRIEKDITSPPAPTSSTKRTPLFEGLAKHLGFDNSARSYKPPVFTRPTPPSNAKARRRHYHLQCRTKCVTGYMGCMGLVANVEQEIVVCSQGRDGCIQECSYILARKYGATKTGDRWELRAAVDRLWFYSRWNWCYSRLGTERAN